MTRHADLIKALRDCAHIMPEGGKADAMIEVLSGIALEAAQALEDETARAERFRDHLMRRPANNAALPNSYILWSAQMYLVDDEAVLRDVAELVEGIAAKEREEKGNLQ